MSAEEFTWRDPERLGGRVCFRNTRVPVDALFENLEDGVSVADFLDAFEGVTREQVVGVLEEGQPWNFAFTMKPSRSARIGSSALPGPRGSGIFRP
jgi:uncharacterized protein (DUF433 family)